MRKSMLLGICAILIAIGAFAQTTPVTGKVMDDKGAPVSGASVLEKGTKNGTTTSNDGSFSFKVKPGATLVVSGLGFETKQITASSSNLMVELATDVKSLNEVVVTGTGIATSRRKLGTAVESVTSDKLPAGLTADAGQALVGKIAGAQISSTNGNPGQPVNILLRGINSLRAGTLPMILLDGIQIGATDLNTIDLNIIERIEVVQGAASASLYGAQGANGVIQLFSKKGKGGKTSIDVSSSIANSSLLNVGNVHKAYFHSLDTDANNNVLGSGGGILSFTDNLSTYEENVGWNSLDPNTNNNKPYDKNLKWYDHNAMFFKTANTINNSIAISGSRDKMDFNFSASDNKQETVFKGNGDFRRSNIFSSLGVELMKNLRFRSTTQVALTKNTLLDPTGRTYFYALNNSRPFANYDFKMPDGSYGAYFGDAVGVNGYNPNFQSQYGSFQSKKIDLIQNFNLNYRFNRFVELDAKYGLNYQTQNDVNIIQPQDNNLNADYWQYWLEYYYPRTSFASPTSNVESGELNNTEYKTTFQNFVATANIRFDFQRDFKLKIPLKSSTLIGYDYRKNNFSQYATWAADIPSFTPFNATQLATQRVATDLKSSFLTYGYLIDQKFEWADIAGVTAGFRSDYSSAFGRGQTPQAFPHANGFLRISEFDFWKNSKLSNKFTEFKIRAAYGEAGIQPGAFDRQPTLTTRNMGTASAFVFRTNNPNPDLNVEISKELEIGTDMGFSLLEGSWFKTANLSFTYWKRSSDNTIYAVDAAPSSGTGTVLNNAYGLKSNGIQASLNLGVYSSKDFTWNFTALFSKQTSEISSVIGQPVVVTSAAGSVGLVLNAGEKIGQLYGFRMLRAVDETDEQGKVYIAKADQANFQVASNGWVVYSNPALPNYKQPYVTPNTYSLGDPNPKFNMSFINEFAYKDFLQVSFQVDWINGSNLYNQTKGWMYRDGIHSDYDNPVTINGTTGAWAAFYRGAYAQVSRNGTKNYYYEDASFARLRNISAAIDFARLFKIKQVRKLQLVLSGRNLLTATKYTGYDPEISSGESNSAFDRGVDHNTVPNLKTYQVGLNIGF
jgi:TonB-dependent starch-binding outer membrane protein SusC